MRANFRHVVLKTAALLGAVAPIALLTAAAASAGPTDWTTLRALNITHQGGENEVPSATMYAFERSMKLGSDMLEVDVNTTKDAKLAIIHDGAVDRTTNGTGPVADYTMAQLRKLDAAQWFVPLEGTTQDAPANQYVFRGVRTGQKKPPPGYGPGDFRPLELSELMDRYPGVPINIEIKGGVVEDDASYLHVADVLADFLNRYGRTKGIVVASFNDAALAHFHELAPEIDLAPATAAVAGYVLGGVPLPPGYEVFQVPPSFQGIPVVTQDFVDRAHGDGYAVHVWTIDDVETMNELWDYGVDGIMSAEPMRLEHNMCQRDEPRPPAPEELTRHALRQERLDRLRGQGQRRQADQPQTGQGHAHSQGRLRQSLRRHGHPQGDRRQRSQEEQVQLRLALARGRRPRAGPRQGQAQRGPPGIDRAPREGPGADASVRGVRDAVDEGCVAAEGHSREVAIFAAPGLGRRRA